MLNADRERNRDRLKASIGVAAFHALLGYALITGLGFEVVRAVSDNLKTFDVQEPLPPPLQEQPKPDRASPEEEGAAAPPNLKSEATPLVAPPPKIRLEVPPPVVSAPLPTPRPGNDPTAGASTVKGPGTGAGGEGTGTGSGGSGTGTGGGGGGGRAAQLERGSLRNQDYPRSALRAGIEGSVAVRFTVQTDGRVSGCTVVRSSGNEDLDSTTCRLIERRFRYRPALDGQGRPVPEVVRKSYDWLIPRLHALPPQP